MPEISQHSYDIAVVAIRRDHTSGVSVLKVYRPWPRPTFRSNQTLYLLTIKAITYVIFKAKLFEKVAWEMYGLEWFRQSFV